MIQIDTQNGKVTLVENGQQKVLALNTPEAFSAVSKAWLRAGWDVKYVYTFSWLGRPIIQLPEDMIRMQELLFLVQPDVIIETGVAHGGSLIYYASICKAMGRGRVIGIDIEIRPHNRKAIEDHFLFPHITLIEGSSIEPSTLAAVRKQIKEGEKTLVILDSCHTKAHVLAELQSYSPFVTPGSYIVAMDGIMQEVVGAPRTREDWAWNNPIQAAFEFTKSNADFALEEPKFPFNEGMVSQRVTYAPHGIIKRLR